MTRWEMRIGFGQVVIMWAVLAGIMVLVFMFGFHAGREQGLGRALDGVESEAVRLPIAQPVPIENEELGALALNSGISENSSESDPSAGLSSNTTKGADSASDGQATSNPENEPEFDFSRSAAVTGADAEKLEVTAGLSSKPALEMFKNEAESKPGSNLAALEEKKKQAEDIAAKELEALVKKPEVPKNKQAKTVIAGKGLSQISPPLKKEEAVKPKIGLDLSVESPISDPKIKEPGGAGTSTPTGKTKKTTQKIKVESAGTKLASGWYVQSAATRSKEDAAALVVKFASNGLPGVIEQAEVRGRVYYRVLVGPYGEQAEAVGKKAKVKNSGITGGEPFLKHVK